MNDVLKSKYPYLSTFFSAILKSPKHNIANSLIFYGSDLLAQYYLALSLAKSLNCLKNGDDDCDCVNCNWVRTNKHPAVLTISKVDNKNDERKTVISKQQVDSVRDSLVNSSSYHRVFIFCDAEYKLLSESEKNTINEFASIEYSLPQSEDEDQQWFPKGLTKACFQDVAANALLKSIEEPPSNVTFIFLTEDKDDLISTVVSRSQSFFVPSFSKEKFDTLFMSELMDGYPNLKVEDSLKFAKKLVDFQTKSGFDSSYVLDCLQAYLKDFLLANRSNKSIFYSVLQDIDNIQKAKKMIAAHLKEALVYEDLAFSLHK